MNTLPMQRDPYERTNFEAVYGEKDCPRCENKDAMHLQNCVGGGLHKRWFCTQCSYCEMMSGEDAENPLRRIPEAVK